MEINKALKEKIAFFLRQLQSNQSEDNWSQLAEVTLCRIILFNKRRSGEASRMTVDQYTSASDWLNSSEEVKSSLTSTEKELCKRLHLVNITGKRGRNVPVIFTPETKEAVDVLLEHRTDVGISKKNPYVFARLHGDSENAVRGSDVLRKLLSTLKLSHPEAITSTNLRKYVATVCQVFNMSEVETDWLARHLGHDIRIHRNFYRLHEHATELGKVSRLLMAVDSGKANQFRNKKLDEIDINGKHV